MLSIKGGKFVLPGGVKKDQSLVVDKGKIIALNSNQESQETIELANSDIVFPGFIDMHIHGGGGFDVMEDSEETLKKIAVHLASFGVTGWLPTTYSSDVVDMADVGAAASWLLATKDIGAEILGINHEGPFLSKSMRGAQPESKIINPDLEKAEELIAPAAVSIMTVAPELPKATEVIKLIKNRNLIAAIGHSDADYSTAVDAINNGATHVTHCFNAMREFHHRDPGILGAALISEDLTCELIADLVHVCPAAMEILIKIKTPKKVALISDAISPTGLKEGIYQFAGQHIQVKNNIAKMDDGTIAGSVLTLNLAVKNLIEKVGLSISEAAEMAATTPANILGLGNKRGSISEGLEASLTILDKDYNALYTIVGGNIVYQKEAKELNPKLE